MSIITSHSQLLIEWDRLLSSISSITNSIIYNEIEKEENDLSTVHRLALDIQSSIKEISLEYAQELLELINDSLIEQLSDTITHYASEIVSELTDIINVVFEIVIILEEKVYPETEDSEEFDRYWGEIALQRLKDLNID